MTASPIRFFFDFISPYAYLAWTQIYGLAERHGREVELTPTLLAPLLNANGQKGPAEIPNKRRALFKDCARTAHRIHVPFEPPPAHPFNPLLALRVASIDLEPGIRRKLVDGLFQAAWGGGGGVTDPALVAAIATRAGLDGARVVADAATAEIKDRVRRQTEEALALGAFGVPTMIVDRELFWGFDSFDNLDLVLRGFDPVSAEDVERWEHLPASATR